MKRPAVSRPAVPPRPVALDYPDSDGQPIAETDFQRKPMWYANDVLARRYRGRPDVYVSANLFVYYEEGNPRAVVAPDVFVVLGVAGHDRRTYKVWEEGKGPDFVLEVTSRSTRGTDQGSKRQVYAKLGVSEYWRFDPTGPTSPSRSRSAVSHGARSIEYSALRFARTTSSVRASRSN